MNTLLQRLAIHHEVGLAIGDRGAAVRAVACTLVGRVETARASATYAPEEMAAAVGRLLAGAVRREDLSRSRVSVGLPTLRIFFSTRSIQAKHREAAPLTLLHEVIQSPSLNLDEMAVDLIKPKVGGKPLASLASCRKRYLSEVMAALDGAEVRADRAEPAPCAMVRVAAWRHRSPRKARSLVRVFLGADQGLAVLTSGDDLPLMWRPFDLPAGSEPAAILAAIASVRVLGGYCGLRHDIDAVLVHGRADLGPLPDVVGGPALRGVRGARHDGPDLDEDNVALGLTLAPGPGTASFNLIRSLVGRNKLIHIFPWAQVAVQFAILLGATLFLQDRLAAIEVDRVRARQEGAKFAWAKKLSLTKLQAERKDLEGQVGSVQGFLAGRALWTDLGRALGRQLTPELTFTSLQGFYEIETPDGKGGKPRRSMNVRVSTPIPRTAKLPPAIEAFVRNVRDEPTLKKLFPEVDLADLRSVQGFNKNENASFGVTFRPAKSAPARKPDAGDAAKEKDRKG